MSVNVYDPVNNELIPVAGATLFAEMPLGAILAFDAEEVPDGWLIFNGQTVLRSDYPDLWARANRNNQVGVGKFYGIGDGSTNFTLADLRETSLKGYGETSRSVGAHVKSGGLGVGEFIDDQLQEHKHYLKNPLNSSNSLWISSVDASNYGSSDLKSGGNDSGNPQIFANTVYNARTGTTTEVKAVGVVWAVKAKLTGLPVDLAQQMENYVTSFPMFIGEWLFTGSGSEDSTTLYTFTVPKDGKLKYIGKDISKVSESYSFFYINDFIQVPFGSSMNEVSVTKGSTIIISRQKNAIGNLTVYLV